MRLLLVGDAGVTTGFATVLNNLAKQFKAQFDAEIHILAINYFGDYHWVNEYARLYSCRQYNLTDAYGYTRISNMIEKIKPDVVLIVNDPCNLSEYALYLQHSIDNGLLKHRPVYLAYTPIDSKHIKYIYTPQLKWFDGIIAYTESGKVELIVNGVEAENIHVIPHGVDTDTFYPVDKKEARNLLGLERLGDDAFIVNMTDRNSPRKQIDLGMHAFAKWLEKTRYPNIYFYYHGGLFEPDGPDLVDLKRFFGIEDRFITTKSDMVAGYGIKEDALNMIYNAADIGLSCSLGEGFGLTSIERMACKVPMIVPKHSAFTDWPRIKVTDPETSKHLGTITGVHYMELAEEPRYSGKTLNTLMYSPKLSSIVESLDFLYNDKDYREGLAEIGYGVATQDKFQWKNVAKEFYTLFETMIEQKQNEQSGTSAITE